jgi:hypothetical protein
MPDPKPTYFELQDNIGVDDAGNLQPLHQESLTLVVFYEAADGSVAQSTESHAIEPAEKIMAAQVVRARIIPDTRIIESHDGRVDEHLRRHPNAYREIDPPTKKHLEAAVKATQDAREHATEFGPNGELKDEARGQATAAIPTVPTNDDARGE